MYDIIFLGNKDETFYKLKSKFPMIKNADSFESAQKKALTKFFWIVWPDTALLDTFDFDYVPDQWSSSYIHSFKNGSYYDGIVLVPKKLAVTQKEIDYRFFRDKKEVDIIASTPVPYEIFRLNSYEEYLTAIETSTTDMFWVVWNDVEVKQDFKFDYYIPVYDSFHRQITHVFKNGEYYDGICLFSKSKPVSKHEFDHRFFINKKEIDIVASTPKSYDLYYVDNWNEYEHALETSSTEMFWAVSRNLEYNQSYVNNFYFSHHNSYDRKENHAFAHEVNGKKLYNGVFLCSKNKPLNKKQIDYRFLVNAKQWEDVVSGPTQYEIYSVCTYEDYLSLLSTAKTELFWIIPSGVQVKDDFTFDMYFSHDNEFDRKINHVFKNGEYYDGVILCSKHSPISEREFKYRFITNKKEHDIVASNSLSYDRIVAKTYKEFCELKESVLTDFFYVVPDDVDVNWNFNYHIPYYERDVIHLFKNGNCYDGIFLIHKDRSLTQREFDYRFFVNKKEVDIIASNVKEYDKIYVDNYDDFVKQLTTVKSKFVWVIPNDVDLNWDFNYHIPYYERDNIHVFKNGKYHDGVFIIHKDKPLTQREFDYRFFINKKEIDTIVSTPKPYDIVFISYNEPNADDNYSMLIQRFPEAKRIHGVKGIHQAHIKAAELCTSTMFWVVDGDAYVLESFNFDYQAPKWQQDQVFVWRSINPINDLEYGYGGVKLLPRSLTLNMDLTKPDMTTSISDKFKAVEEVSNVTAFNTDEFSTWRSAFRECCKLASKTIKGQINDETNERLARWCSAYGRDRLFGDYAISGARAGRKYGNDNVNNADKLKLINDFDWLKEQFDATCR